MLQLSSMTAFCLGFCSFWMATWYLEWKLKLELVMLVGFRPEERACHHPKELADE
jgi:hypothetical protein